MARKFLTAVDLVQNELQNAAVQSLAGAPSNPVKFQIYGNSADNTVYWWDGTTWQSAKGGVVPFGTITAETAFGGAKADGVATTSARSDHKHGTPTHVDADHAAIHLNALAAPTADVSMGGFKLTTVGAPASNFDATNKQYVDSLLQGLSWKEAVRVGTTGNVTQSGLAGIDGVAPLVVNDRILCKDQTDQTQNGIFLAQTGAWTRPIDADSAGDLEGAAVFVREGTLNPDKAWVCNTDGLITPGTTPNSWVQFGGGAAVTDGDKTDITVTGGGSTWTIDPGVVTNAKLATVPGLTIKGNSSGATAAPVDLTALQARAILGAPKIFVQATIGGATSQVVTHNLTSQAVIARLYRTLTPFEEVECDVEHTSTSTITLRFAVAPAANEYTVVVMG